MDSGVEGNEDQVSVTADDDGGEKCGSVRQSPSRHYVGEDDDVQPSVELPVRTKIYVKSADNST